MRRYQLRTATLAIEADFSPAGLQYLEHLRKLRPDLFKGGRIVDILQMGDMPTGIVYERGGKMLGEPWKV